MAQTNTPVRISDLIRFSEVDYKETKKTLATMNEMVREYVKNIDNLDELEALKRRFNSYLVYLATYYSKIKCFEENHIMLDGVRKKIKSEAILHMIKNSDEKLSQAAAEKVVYSYPYYVERVELLTQLREFFTLVNLQYANYQDCQRSIYQSISLLSKQRDSTIS